MALQRRWQYVMVLATVHRPQLSNCFMVRQPAVLPWRDRNTEVKTDMKGEMDGDVIRIIFIRISGHFHTVVPVVEKQHVVQRLNDNTPNT